jgi:hypothetical protein
MMAMNAGPKHETNHPFETNIQEGIWRIVTYPGQYTYLEHRCSSTDRRGDEMPWRGEWKVLTFWEECCGMECIHCQAVAPDGMQSTFMFLKSAPEQGEATGKWLP